jgi:hypothetical protein
MKAPESSSPGLRMTAERSGNPVDVPGISVRHGSFNYFTKLTKPARLTKKDF